MEQGDLEGIAEAILAEAGQEDDRAPKLAQLVTELLGPGSVEQVTNLRTDGELVRIRDQWRIYLKRGLALERRAFALSHEIGEWWFRVRERYEGADVEHAANYVAAAIMSPRRAFRRAVAEHGRGFSGLAAAFRTSETQVALRDAELSGTPRAVVTPALVRVRGPEGWVWPSEQTLRRWARGSTPGVLKVRLADDPKRVVLDPEEEPTG